MLAWCHALMLGHFNMLSCSLGLMLSCSHALMLSCTHVLLPSCSDALMLWCSHALVLRDDCEHGSAISGAESPQVADRAEMFCSQRLTTADQTVEEGTHENDM